VRALSALVSLILWGSGFLLSFVPSGAAAQQALRAARVTTRELPAPLLTLRPEPGLERLAENVAGVLELRTGQRVEVGDAPPPGLLEAVPAGHIAMALRDGSVLLVLGASGGRSLDASVQLGDQAGPADARAVALAAEALRDTAFDLAHRPGDALVEAPVAEPPLAAARSRAQGNAAADTGEGDGNGGSSGGLFGDVDPLFYVRAYSGASTASEGPMMGLGTGLGLCVEGHCLVVGGELPIGAGPEDGMDVRYRYPTFSSGFYSRPFQLGAFTPGASIGLLTRLGHFGADMGLSDRGLETDLAARGSLELAWQAVRGVDLMLEGGVDYNLDRHVLTRTTEVVRRGDRVSPWGQAALRFRP
jgi:hypothetical protein